MTANQAPLVLLHTASSNVDAFTALLAETASDVPAAHVLRDDLLKEAFAAGELTEDIRRRTAETLQALAENGSGLVLCTCSTIGPGADDADAESRKRDFAPVLRIDRPMAEIAVTTGGRIGVAATFDTTMKPTMDLIADAGRRLDRECKLVPYLFAEGRALFEAGDTEGYFDVIAAGLRAAAAETDVVVLAQASMMPALERAGELPVPVLSSPRSGLDAAVAVWRTRAAAGQAGN